MRVNFTQVQGGKFTIGPDEVLWTAPEPGAPPPRLVVVPSAAAFADYSPLPGEVVLHVEGTSHNFGATTPDIGFHVLMSSAARGKVGLSGGAVMEWEPPLDGTDGEDGAPGASAYQVAVANGFIGTEAEWLASLQGSPGLDGQDAVYPIFDTAAEADAYTAANPGRVAFARNAP